MYKNCVGVLKSDEETFKKGRESQRNVFVTFVGDRKETCFRWKICKKLFVTQNARHQSGKKMCLVQQWRKELADEAGSKEKGFESWCLTLDESNGTDDQWRLVAYISGGGITQRNIK